MVQDPWAAAGVREGDLLAGKYRVERVLGVGGMGVVVAARHLQLDERVAIKCLLSSMLAERAAVQRFLREAKAAVRIKNEHVVRVFDVGTLENGAPFMVMEFLEGGDLSAWLQARGAMPVEQAVDFVLQTCVALADAHSMGVVHRDLKPSNLFCVRRSDGRLVIKVLDFGISKLVDAAQADGAMSMTKTTAIMGSPLYMSPEQMRSSKDVDARTDIWALGVILYELLSGTPPFVGASLTEVAVKVAIEPVPSLRVARPDVPPALEAVIAACLQKDPSARHANVAHVAAALAPFASTYGRESADRIAGVLDSAQSPPERDLDPTLRAPSSPSSPPYVAADTTGPPIGRTATDKPARISAVAVVMVAMGAVALFLGGRWAAIRYASRALPGDAVSVVATGPESRPPPPPVPPELSAVLPPAPEAPPLVAKPPQDVPATTPPAHAGSTQPPHAGSTQPHAGSTQPPHAGSTQPPPHSPGQPGALPSAAPPPVVDPPPPRPPPPTATKPACNPPYFIDAAGHRQYKPECL